MDVERGWWHIIRLRKEFYYEKYKSKYHPDLFFNEDYIKEEIKQAFGETHIEFRTEPRKSRQMTYVFIIFYGENGRRILEHFVLKIWKSKEKLFYTSKNYAYEAIKMEKMDDNILSIDLKDIVQ